jgi:two-component system LytT family sensor kinase
MTSRARAWMLALAGAFIYTAAQTTSLSLAIRDVSWLELFAYELPVWLAVLAISPLVFWLARKLPLVGRHALRNAFAHLVPATLVLLLQFVLVETIRRFLISPLVLATGLAASSPGGVAYARLGADRPVFFQILLSFRAYLVFFVFVYFALVLFYYSVQYYRELHSARLHGQELQTMLARSQLDSLRLQLQPHFLFNTLNTISSLMTRDVALARRTIARLSDLLRETLRDSDVHEVSLTSELRFLDAYLAIQEARFGARMRVEKVIAPDTTDLLVPRMLLQPLVENSIEHGMSEDRLLCIRVEAELSGASLLLRVVDDGIGLRGRELIEQVGLSNTRERLQRLYGSNHEMDVTAPATGGFTVALRIPARPAWGASASVEHEREIA